MPETSPVPKSRGWLISACAILWAMIRKRCPRCHTGKMFRGMFTMNDPCPVCGLLFQREEGYYLGAMYPSYILSSGLMTLLYFSLQALLPAWSAFSVAFLAIGAFLPFTLWIFQYARVLWIYFERAVCPGTISAQAYEKVRLEQQSQAKDLAPRLPSQR